MHDALSPKETGKTKSCPSWRAEGIAVMIVAIYPKIRRFLASFRSVIEAGGVGYPGRRIFYDNSGRRFELEKNRKEVEGYEFVRL